MMSDKNTTDGYEVEPFSIAGAEQSYLLHLYRVNETERKSRIYLKEAEKREKDLETFKKVELKIFWKIKAALMNQEFTDEESGKIAGLFNSNTIPSSGKKIVEHYKTRRQYAVSSWLKQDGFDEIEAVVFFDEDWELCLKESVKFYVSNRREFSGYGNFADAMESARLKFLKKEKEKITEQVNRRYEDFSKFAVDENIGLKESYNADTLISCVKYMLDITRIIDNLQEITREIKEIKERR
jgi:hypothetical protein